MKFLTSLSTLGKDESETFNVNEPGIEQKVNFMTDIRF
jgi:hypothetical protein